MTKCISDFLKNNCKSIFSGFSIPQKGSVSQLLRQILAKGSGILRELSEGKKLNPRWLAQKYSHHLGNVDLLEPVESYCDRRLLRLLNKNEVIAYDLTDISKKSAKKIENISGTFDGSRREKSRGYFVHGVGFRGYLWRLRLHNNDKKFLPQERRSILEELVKITASKTPIFALDRGNDSTQTFEDLDEFGARWIVRLKNNRNVIMKNTGEIIKIENLEEGRYSVLIETQESSAKKRNYAEYELVIHKKQKSKKDPIRLLISKNLDPKKEYSNKKITNLYLRRWGVENSFKHIKTNLNLEKIRVMKFKKYQNFVSLIHLASVLNEIFFRRIKNNFENLVATIQNISFTQIFYHYKKFNKHHSLTINSSSFLKFFRTIIPQFYHHRKNTTSTTNKYDPAFLQLKLMIF